MHINLLNYLDKESVVMKLKGKTKREILSRLLDHLISAGKIQKTNKKEILKALVQREEMGSTAIGGGIALPHIRLECIDNIILCIGISKEGVDFDALDDGPVHIIILLLSSQKEAGQHLKLLAFLARMLRDKYFLQQLRNAVNEEEVISSIKKQQTLMR